MKKYPSSSSTSSSSSSSVGSNPHQPEKPRTQIKRVRRNVNLQKCKNADSSSTSRRSSIYRGVTRHRWTGRFEAHLWDKSTWNDIQNKKGRQGAYESEEAAARTYDLAALKYWGPDSSLNFPIDTYKKELEEMQKVSKEEYLASLRRQSSGFSRGVSKYRGVARHHHNGRWEARIGRVFGNKYLYLGTYSTQEEAAAAYDLAAIEHRGANAVTNFDISNYARFVKKSLPQDEQHQQPNHNCQIQTEVDQQEQQQQMVLPQLQSTHLLPCLDSTTMVMMDPIVDDNELTWSLCLDSGFNPLPDFDFPLEKPGDLPDLFDNTGFEDNIDLIFDGGYEENLGCIDTKGSGVVGENGLERLSSSSSSSPSSSTTTTSVSCIYSV
ncbi:hypothetical protein L1049_011120 [Liquidambar formosana]|uniref:AP2/ERF domain-containing protein n=1 Tax=Liquidambar formosana TaxID=63359 RepID=A0AAP0X2F5_LIQFO